MNIPMWTAADGSTRDDDDDGNDEESGFSLESRAMCHRMSLIRLSMMMPPAVRRAREMSEKATGGASPDHLARLQDRACPRPL